MVSPLEGKDRIAPPGEGDSLASSWPFSHWVKLNSTRCNKRGRSLALVAGFFCLVIAVSCYLSRQQFEAVGCGASPPTDAPPAQPSRVLINLYNLDQSASAPCCVGMDACSTVIYSKSISQQQAKQINVRDGRLSLQLVVGPRCSITTLLLLRLLFFKDRRRTHSHTTNSVKHSNCIKILQMFQFTR